MTIWTQLATITYFETKRLIVRPFSYADGDDFYNIVSSPANLPFLFPSQVDRALALDMMVEKFMRSPLGKWALVDKGTNKMIGALCFEVLDEHKKTAEISYFLKRDYWRQGLMTEVVQQLVFLAFDKLELRELMIVTHLENLASQSVARKAGFKQVEQYRGSDRYSHKMRNYLKFSLKKVDVRSKMDKEKE